MDLIADILLIGGALGVTFYCFVLSRRLTRFTDLERGMGGAVAVLSAQVDDLTRALDAARKAADGSGTTLTELTERAEDVARRLELNVAALHDLDAPDGQGGAVVAQTASTAPVAAAPPAAVPDAPAPDIPAPADAAPTNPAPADAAPAIPAPAETLPGDTAPAESSDTAPVEADPADPEADDSAPAATTRAVARTVDPYLIDPERQGFTSRRPVAVAS